MKGALRLLLCLACGLSMASNARAADAAGAMAAHRYLLGSWHCSFSVGSVRGTYTTSWRTTLDGRWLEQTIDQPPTQGSMMKNGYGSREPGFRATFLVGYDAARNAWVRFGALSTGQYFAMRMADIPRGGWASTYVSFFRQRSVSKPDAVLARSSDTEYRIDGPTYPDDVTHAMVTEHHICTKTPS